jgi:hypothetical protein
MSELLDQGYKGTGNYDAGDWQIEEFIKAVKPLNEIQAHLAQLRIDNKNTPSVEKTGIHNYGRLFGNDEVRINSKSVAHNNAGALIPDLRV